MITKCYYCRFATGDFQTCVDHVISEHDDTILKLRTKTFSDQTDTHGMITTYFGNQRG